jgi:hypothetical protein
MRTFRLSLAGSVILTLIGGLAGIAAAQDEPAPVTFVTGTVAEVYGYGEGESDLATTDLRGYEVMTESALMRQVVEWSDPRLPTDLWLTLGYTLIWEGEDEDEPDGAINHAWRCLLEDEQGRWYGTGRSVKGADEQHSLFTLTGEGAYAGLSALIYGVPPRNPFGPPWEMNYEGYIFEAELTPFPDEPVPLSTGVYQVWPPPTE